MNKSDIEWTDYTWNPITGCLHGCWYCYAKKIACRFHHNFTPEGGKPFDPMFHRNRLSEPRKRRDPSMIFVCSMGDLMGEWVPDWWIEMVIESMRSAPRHTFQLLTKNPKRYLDFEWPAHCWLGASATDQRQWDSAVEVFMLMHLEGHNSASNIFYVSCEPLLSKIHPHNNELVDWIIVGALTGAKMQQYQPPERWVNHLCVHGCGSKMFLKDNLRWPETIKEWPTKTATGVGE